mmetsp:Transcript_88636/g.266659  ORF Transcript_88636/g.266659 Transcript_88636/m.266659 type:complete len:207 (-) Transcript_88636:109-729(-)
MLRGGAVRGVGARADPQEDCGRERQVEDEARARVELRGGGRRLDGPADGLNVKGHHAEEARRRRGLGAVDALPILDESRDEARVGVGDASDVLDSLESRLVVEVLLPHQVGDHHARRARDALVAVHVDLPLGRGLLDERDRVIEDGGDILSWVVVEVQRLVLERPLVVVAARDAGGVEDVRDAVRLKKLQVARRRVRTQEHGLGDL